LQLFRGLHGAANEHHGALAERAGCHLQWDRLLGCGWQGEWQDQENDERDQ
jgi:hypothetical protein